MGKQIGVIKALERRQTTSLDNENSAELREKRNFITPAFRYGFMVKCTTAPPTIGAFIFSEAIPVHIFR